MGGFSPRELPGGKNLSSLCHAINSPNSAERDWLRPLFPVIGLDNTACTCWGTTQILNPDNLYFSSDGDLHALPLSFCIKDLPLIKLINNCWLWCGIVGLSKPGRLLPAVFKEALHLCHGQDEHFSTLLIDKVPFKLTACWRA